VKYGHFIVNAFQQRPGKWRASVKRSDGTPLAELGLHKVRIVRSITHIDSLTAEDALRMAKGALDAGAFSNGATQAHAPKSAMAS
jgi:hypothetical protein